MTQAQVELLGPSGSVKISGVENNAQLLHQDLQCGHAISQPWRLHRVFVDVQHHCLRRRDHQLAERAKLGALVPNELDQRFAVIQAAAPSLRVEVSPVNVGDAGEIERAVTAFARSPNGGLIVPAGGTAQLHRNLIIALAARHKLPAIYYDRYFVAAGGLMSYGPDNVGQFRRAASYVDRILKGEKPSDLPVQQPTKYDLIINLKTAKALGLEVPPTLLARADEVIE